MPPHLNRLAYPRTSRLSTHQREDFIRKLLGREFSMSIRLTTLDGMKVAAFYQGLVK